MNQRKWFSMYTLALVVSLVFGGQAWAQTYTVKSCKINFETTGSPVLVKIIGSSKKPCTGSVKVENGVIKSSEFVLDLSDLDTGIPLRNKHLRENYLHVAQFPSATLKLSSANGLATQLQGASKAKEEFSGTLTLRGKEAPLKNATYNFTGPNQLVAKFSVMLADHSVETPSFMGVKVVDQVHLTVTMEVQN